MVLISTFIVGLLFSYLGSVPPGMINISVLQMSMQNKKGAALSFTTAAVLVEFIYAAIAVRFQIFLTENNSITGYFQLITASVLIIIGLVNLFKKKGGSLESRKGEKRNAFKRGILISLANPLAIPFWLAVTAYLHSMNWIILVDSAFWLYISGISAGTFLLLTTIILLTSRYSLLLNNHFIVYRVPGLIFIAMGLWSMYQWLL